MPPRMATPVARRQPLSKERVLLAAIDLADQGGIDALSMRKLAQELSVEPMSLYYYVTNKDDLLGGMLDIIVGEFELASSAGDWKAAIRRSAISAHDVLMRHRWATNLMMSGKGISLPRMRYMEALLGRLREAGFSAQMTHHAYHALDSHIIGSTLWQTGMSSQNISAERAKTFLSDLPADEFRYLLEHAEQHFAPRKRDGLREFDFGLDLILDGLEKFREPPTPRPRRRDAPRATRRRSPQPV